MTDEEIPGFRVRENFRHQGEERERQRVEDVIRDYFWALCACGGEGLCSTCLHEAELLERVRSGYNPPRFELRRDKLTQIKAMLETHK